MRNKRGVEKPIRTMLTWHTQTPKQNKIEICKNGEKGEN